MIKNILRDSGIVFFGTVVSQIIPILFTPLIASFYIPEDFGVFTSITAIAAILGNSLNLKYNNAIILPSTERESIDIVKLSIILSLTFGVLSLLTIIILSLFQNRFLIYLYACILGILISINQSFYLYAARKGDFKINSISKLAVSVFYVICALILGYYTLQNGLIYSRIFGVLTSILFLSMILKLNIKQLNITEIKNLKKIAQKYSEHPKLNLIPSLLDIVSLQLPLIIVGVIFGDNIQGQYGLANSLISVPFFMITLGIRDSAFKHFNDLFLSKKTTDLNKIHRQISVIIFVFIILLAFLLFHLLPFIIDNFFSKDWNLVIIVSTYLIFSSLIKVIPSSLSSILIITGNVSLLSKWQIFNFLLISLYMLFIQLGNTVSLRVFLFGYVAVEGLTYAAYFFIQRRSLIQLNKA